MSTVIYPSSSNTQARSRSSATGSTSAERRHADLAAALVISTYQRPGHLRRALLSASLQCGAAGRFEVVVTDDGSQDETADLVAQFADRVDFPVRFTTHRHQGFQLARCRNEGVRATTAPYLLFLDGDLALPPDFVAQHLARRRVGVAMAGDSCYLPEDTSAQVDEEAIRQARFLDWIPAAERRRLSKKHFRARFYNLLCRPTLPRFKGGNIGLWRSDYERVNGYDENFVGWGLEETDLQWRIARQGVRFRSSMGWTRTCHLWHPPSASFTPKARDTDNERYLRRPGRLSVCRNGLRRRPLEELAVHVTGAADHPRARQLLRGRFASTPAGRRCEVEIHFAAPGGRFVSRAECNVLVVLDAAPLSPRLARQSHLLVCDRSIHGASIDRRFSLDQFDAALDSIA